MLAMSMQQSGLKKTKRRRTDMESEQGGGALVRPQRRQQQQSLAVGLTPGQLPCHGVEPLAPLRTLKEQYANVTIKRTIEELERDLRFTSWRSVRGDGNCFYRAFAVGYLELVLQPLLQRQDRSELDNLLGNVVDIYDKDAPLPEPAMEVLKALTSLSTTGGTLEDEAVTRAPEVELIVEEDHHRSAPTSPLLLEATPWPRLSSSVTAAVSGEERLARPPPFLEVHEEFRALRNENQELKDKVESLLCRNRELEDTVEDMRRAMIKAGLQLPPLLVAEDRERGRAQHCSSSASSDLKALASESTMTWLGSGLTAIDVMQWLRAEERADGLVMLFRWLTVRGLYKDRDTFALYLPDGQSVEDRAHSILTRGEEAEHMEIQALTMLLGRGVALFQVFLSS
jgi:hypothetical protein